MTNPPSTTVTPPPAPRPVLVWQEEGDESRVEPSLGEAARSLNVSEDAVLGAIAAGEPLQGWFVDWQAQERR